MKRRRLLGLLGLAATGGAAKLYADGERPSSDGQTGLPSGFDGQSGEPTETNWGERLQSRLQDRPTYGTPSFAGESRVVEFDETESSSLSVVTAEPADVGGDKFRFDVRPGTTPAAVRDLVTGTLRLTADVSVEKQIDGETTTFVGGDAGVGSFAGAVASHPTEPAVLLVRARDAEQLATTVRASW